jgi:dTDP-4-amino-4,6-dideoxygalactose transaminase
MLLINDLRRHQEFTAPLISEALTRVVASGWFILGTESEAFEREFSDYCGVPHAAGVANGTDAIEVALRALGVRSEDLVATVANAGFYTCIALNAIGAKPLFIDVDAQTHVMDIERLEEALETAHPAAIVVTHLYGQLADMARLMKLAEHAGIPVLEDCAQAHGAARAGRRAGSFGDAASFSFYPTKNLGAIGDGGAIVTRHAHVDLKVRQLRQYGWSAKYRVMTRGGRNSRLDELQAAVLRAKLPLLDGWNERRRAIARRYSEGLRHTDLVVPLPAGPDYVAHLYVIRARHRDLLRAHLQTAGISAEVHYPIPDPQQPVWQGSMAAELPVTEKLAREVVTLPCFPELSDSEVDSVIAVVNAWLN